MSDRLLEQLCNSIASTQSVWALEDNPFDFSLQQLTTIQEELEKNPNINTLKFNTVSWPDEEDSETSQKAQIVFSMVKRPYKAVEVCLPGGGEHIQFLRDFISHARCQTFVYTQIINDQYRLLKDASVRTIMPSLLNSSHIEFLIFTCSFSPEALSELSKNLPLMPRLKGIGFRKVLSPKIHDIPELFGALAECKLRSFRLSLTTFKPRSNLHQHLYNFLNSNASTLQSLHFHVKTIQRNQVDWLDDFGRCLSNCKNLQHLSLLPLESRIFPHITHITDLDVRGFYLYDWEQWGDVSIPHFPSLVNLNTFTSRLVGFPREHLEVFSQLKCRMFEANFCDLTTTLAVMDCLSRNPHIRRVLFHVSPMLLVRYCEQISYGLEKMLQKNQNIVEVGAPLNGLIARREPDFLQAFSQVVSVVDIMSRSQSHMQPLKDMCRSNLETLLQPFNPIFRERVLSLIIDFCGTKMIYADFDCDFIGL